MLEAALKARYASPDTMQVQIRPLALLHTWKQIEIRIVPEQTELPVVPTTGFAVFDDGLVRIETPGGELRLEESNTPSRLQGVLRVLALLLAGRNRRRTGSIGLVLLVTLGRAAHGSVDGHAVA